MVKWHEQILAGLMAWGIVYQKYPECCWEFHDRLWEALSGTISNEICGFCGCKISCQFLYQKKIVVLTFVTKTLRDQIFTPPWKCRLGVGGGGIKFLVRGGSKHTPPPPPLKNSILQKKGGGYTISRWRLQHILHNEVHYQQSNSSLETHWGQSRVKDHSNTISTGRIK